MHDSGREDPADPLAVPRPGPIARLIETHPWIVDAILLPILVLVSTVVFPVVYNGFHEHSAFDGWLALIPLAATASLLVRRRHPLVAMGVVTVSGVLTAVLDAPAIPLILAAAIAAVAVYSRVLFAVIAAVGALAVIMAATLLAGHFLDDSSMLIIAAVVGLLLGSSVGNRRRYLLALVDRAAHLEVERDQQARLAVATERVRIARELHDIVAHGLAVMVKLADAAEAVVDTDPHAARTAVRHIGESGRGAMDDMRRLLDVLRDEAGPADRAPQPRITNLEALVAAARATGLPASLEIVGTPPDTDSIQLVVFRTVQEGLTNTIRYAERPTAVRVLVETAADAVVVEITDDGVGTSDAPSVGSANGLLGLRERARAYGGVLTAGRRTDGVGWSTRLALPLPHPAPTTEETT